MAKYEVIYSQLTEIKLLQISDYLVKNWSVQIAENFQKIFLKKVKFLSKNPKIGRRSSKYVHVRSISITNTTGFITGSTSILFSLSQFSIPVKIQLKINLINII